jgi:hypothetical protein
MPAPTPIVPRSTPGCAAGLKVRVRIATDRQKSPQAVSFAVLAMPESASSQPIAPV